MTEVLSHQDGLIRTEHTLTVAEVLRLTNSADLLASQPEIIRTLAVREPYPAPISYLQIDLLHRTRSADPGVDSDPALQRAMLITING